jgi:hypothetical protein
MIWLEIGGAFIGGMAVGAIVVVLALKSSMAPPW